MLFSYSRFKRFSILPVYIVSIFHARCELHKIVPKNLFLLKINKKHEKRNSSNLSIFCFINKRCTRGGSNVQAMCNEKKKNRRDDDIVEWRVNALW